MLRIKQVAKEKGVTIASVAKKMGVAPPSLSRVVAGGNTTIENLQKIADALDVPIAELFEKSAESCIECPYCGGKIKISK